MKETEEYKEDNRFIKKPLSERLDLSAVMDVIKIIKESNKRIDPNDFRNATTLDGEPISINIIKEDLEKVELKKNRIVKQDEGLNPSQTRANLIANFVEVAIPESIKNLGWLGADITALDPSLYDDYERGIDSILLYQNEIITDRRDLKTLGLSMDFTISDMQYEKKFFENGLAIAKGGIPKVKYFGADVMTVDGMRKIKIIDMPIPKVIISCPQNELLAEAQKHLFEYVRSPKNENKIKDARETTLRYYFIREVLSQLRCFKDLSIKFENKQAEELYNRALESFINLLENNRIDEEVLEERLTGINPPKFLLDDPDGKYMWMIGVISNMPGVKKEEPSSK